MARRQDTRITAALTRLLPRRRIRELARRFGALQRQRKLDIVALVYSLVLGAGAGNRRTLAGLRRAYHRATGVRLASSTFYARFTKEMATLMRTLCFEAMEKLSAPRAKLGSAFRPFREVLAVDSSIIRLHNALEAVYPSVWRHYMRASLKLTVIMNVLGRGAKTVGVTHGSHHDVHLLEAGPWVKGRLLLFDLGFFRAVLFKAIDRHGGYFLSRPRQKSNPVIVRSHQRAHRRLVGRNLRDVPDEAAEDVVELFGLFAEREVAGAVEHMNEGAAFGTGDQIVEPVALFDERGRIVVAPHDHGRPPHAGVADPAVHLGPAA